jgi:hypothetical protein
MDPKSLALFQEAQNKRSAKRSGKTGPRLLDDGENNIGNQTVLQPQVLPAVPQTLPFQVLPWTKFKQSAPFRLLDLTSESKTGQSMTVVMTASRQQNSRGVAGPVVGIIEFGNGTQSTKIEFDIPFGPYSGSSVLDPLTSVAPGTQPEDGITLAQFPTGMLRVYARYDNAYLTPNIKGYVFGENPAIPAISGPFPPNQVAPEDVNPSPNSCPALIKAFAAYYGRVHSKLYKTLYLYNGNAANPVLFGVPVQNLDANTTYVIPAGAKSVTVNRTPFSAGVTVLLGDLISVSGQGIGGYIQIPGGQPSPTIPIIGNQTVVGVFSSDPISVLSLIFEIGF